MRTMGEGSGGFRLLRRSVPAGDLVDDPVQRHVIGHTDGPLLVLGGPGTGKTTVLVEAVASRVAEGVDPERILVLTFGRRPANALRDRIEARIAAAAGAGAVHEPLVRTFHAYAFGLLRRAAAERGEPSPRLLTGPEQDLIIRELLRVAGDDPDPDPDAPPDPVGWPSDMRPALRTRAFAEQLRDLLLRAAERGIGPAELAELGERLGRSDWPAAARFMQEYAAVLALRDATSRGSMAYDYAELVRAAAALLTADPGLLEAERQRVAHVYVDELADTDPAQLDLLALVAGGGKPLVAFADPDSSTYAFRGADPGGVAAFPYRFRTASGAVASAVTLSTCYRTSGELLAAGRRLARRLRGPARHRALTPGPETASGTARVATFRSGTSESAYVAHALREAHLIGGVPWSRMAVLLRSTHLQLPSLQRALQAAGVPTVTLGEDLPLHLQPAVAPLLLLLRCALEPERLDEDAAVALLHSPLGGADPLAERRLRQGLRALAMAAGDRRPSGVLLVEALQDPTELAAVDRRWAAPGKAIGRLLATARDTAARPDATVEDVLWAVWRASGLAERWTAVSLRGARSGPEAGGRQAHQWRAAADRDLDAVVVLFDAAARFVDRLPGARTEVFLDHVFGQDLPADTLAPTADRGDAVRLLTAHAAKGLEWDVVVVAGVQEGIWPDLRLRGSLLGSERLVDAAAGRAAVGGVAFVAGQTSALLDEERRLFYVAVTRARRRLLVTAVASGAVGGAEGEEQPSRFLHELGLHTAAPPAPGDGGAPPPDAGPSPHGGPPPGPGSGGNGNGTHAAPGDGNGAPAATPAHADALPLARPPRALTLPALVAELRTAVADPVSAPTRRRAAAAELARLGAAGVPGAHPDDWWGLRPLSDDRPIVDEDEAIRVTPSTMEGALRCSLRWLLERHGGAAPASAAQGVGNLVHAAAMLADDATTDRQALLDYVSARFDVIELAARWLAGPELARAESMVDKLLRWLAANPRRLLAIERDFLVRLEGAGGRPVDLTGRVDRLEVDAEGRLVVVDLKTGKSTSVTGDDLAAHPQLGAYQAAVEAGAFEEFGTESGGAALVQLGTAKEAKEQPQPPVGDSDDPGWARALVHRTAETMAATTFAAVVNSKCRVCPVHTSCPVSGKGRQVVEPPARPGRQRPHAPGEGR